jgi:hypothetical protein
VHHGCHHDRHATYSVASFTDIAVDAGAQVGRWLDDTGFHTHGTSSGIPPCSPPPPPPARSHHQREDVPLKTKPTQTSETEQQQQQIYSSPICQQGERVDVHFINVGPMDRPSRELSSPEPSACMQTLREAPTSGCDNGVQTAGSCGSPRVVHVPTVDAAARDVAALKLWLSQEVQERMNQERIHQERIEQERMVRERMSQDRMDQGQMSQQVRRLHLQCHP